MSLFLKKPRRISKRGEAIREAYKKWRKDPVAFAREAFGYKLTDHQLLVLKLVMDAADGTGPRKIAVKSGKGLGKSFISSLANLWWLLRHEGTLTVATAPTGRQVKEVWISEALRHASRAVPWLRRWLTIDSSKITVLRQRNWQTRTFAATKKENAQGWHHDHLAVFVEEASGVDRDILDALQETITNSNYLFLLIGNPNQRSTFFFDCFYRFKGWALLTLNAEDSPLVDKAKIAEMEELYGRDSDIFRVSILGEFPLQDARAVFGDEEVIRAMDRPSRENDLHLVKSEATGRVARQVGLDLARFGSDESFLAIRSGHSVVCQKRFVKKEPLEVYRWTKKWLQEKKWPLENVAWCVDAGGIGQGLLGVLYDEEMKVWEFHTNGKAMDYHYANQMTEAWFHLRNLMQKDEMSMFPDEIQRNQLVTRFYSTNPKGKLELESKDDYMDRGPYPSPDRADALAMAFYEPAQTVL